MNDRLAEFLVDSRNKVALVALLIIIGLTMGLSQLQFNGSYKIFFDENNEHLLAHQKNEDTFIKSNNIVFVFETLSGNVYTPENLSSVETMTNEAWQLPYSTRVDSITNYQHTEVIDDDLNVADLVEDALSLSPGQIEKVKQKRILVITRRPRHEHPPYLACVFFDILNRMEMAPEPEEP